MIRFMLSLGVSLIAYSGFSAPSYKTSNNHSARFFQHATISGKVTDNKGQPLAGVTVTAKVTRQRTMTNEEGLFSLETPSAVKILVFTYTGMQTQEVAVNGPSVQNKDY